MNLDKQIEEFNKVPQLSHSCKNVTMTLDEYCNDIAAAQKQASMVYQEEIRKLTKRVKQFEDIFAVIFKKPKLTENIKKVLGVWNSWGFDSIKEEWEKSRKK